eukprot:Opistho-2@96986
MARPVPPPEQSVITQVTRENEGLIPTMSKRDASISLVEDEKKTKQGFFSRLLCCIKPSENLGEITRPLENPEARNDSSGWNGKQLLPPLRACDVRKKCLVLDLDETLVHSSFKPVAGADFIVPVEIDGITHQVYVLKRPYVDLFLKRCGELFECILFTASLAKYADPVTDLLDKNNLFRTRLFREACVQHRGNFVKDLSRLGRDLRHVIIIDNSPASYIFHPENAIPIGSWFDDVNDKELLDLLPFLEDLTRVDDVCKILDSKR